MMLSFRQECGLPATKLAEKPVIFESTTLKRLNRFDHNATTATFADKKPLPTQGCRVSAAVFIWQDLLLPLRNPSPAALNR
jgi:hypothetical protein